MGFNSPLAAWLVWWRAGAVARRFTPKISTGSDGHDGAFHLTANTVVDMADHPDGIYQYSSVNISGNVSVTFIPNANNTPVVWLVQGSCVINGIIDGSAWNWTGQQGFGHSGGAGGGGR